MITGVTFIGISILGRGLIFDFFYAFDQVWVNKERFQTLVITSVDISAWSLRAIHWIVIFQELQKGIKCNDTAK